MSDLIDRQAAIDVLWKALYEYEDKTEKQFQESEGLDVADWIEHRIFVQNMSDIDRQTILALPSAQPEHKTGRWIEPSREGCLTFDCKAYRECSVCGKKQFLADKMNYCPNCGADMRGEKEC